MNKFEQFNRVPAAEEEKAMNIAVDSVLTMYLAAQEKPKQFSPITEHATHGELVGQARAEKNTEKAREYIKSLAMGLFREKNAMPDEADLWGRVREELDGQNEKAA